ncbi:MAG: aquaporin family protein [Actinobacteria bacterium]|nr:MAG: aquaporin family protein [Actinomycetota bacterium]
MLRRAVAEAVGTGLLIVAVVGSGIMATRLSPNDIGLQLLENAIATGGALVALILALGSVSGANFNPVVTWCEIVLDGRHKVAALAYTAVQVVGACLGSIVANVMFELDAIDFSSKARSSGALWTSEVVATAGLLLVIFGIVRSGKAAFVPFAVGAWITGAYFFTSSTSFANPAMFIVMQVIGLGVAIALIKYLFPTKELS